MDEATLEAFRLRFRVTLLEQLVLKTAFATPVLTRRLSAKQSRDVLVGALERSGTEADQAYGEFFQDPSLTALYSKPRSPSSSARRVLARSVRPYRASAPPAEP